MLLSMVILGMSAIGGKTCHVDKVPDPARCYQIEVPVNHDDPSQGLITLQAAVLPALGSPKAPDPVFLLAGGPGQAAMQMGSVAQTALAEVRKRRDVVLLDQRGTTPGLLACPELGRVQITQADALLKQLLECRKRWDLRLDVLNTATLARDTEWARKALGYGEINLWGGSYGTRLGQEYLRRFPASVRVAVLDGVADPNQAIPQAGEDYADSAYQLMLRDCKRHPSCHARFGSLEQLLPRLMRKLSEQPLQGQWRDPLTGALTTMIISDELLIAVLRGALYSTDLRAAIPFALEALEQSNPEPLLALNTALSGAVDSMAMGQTLSVLCADDGWRLDENVISAARQRHWFGDSYGRDWLSFCRAWQSPKAELSKELIKTPVLLISGALDPVTPPSGADAAARAMANVQHLVIANGAHINSNAGCIPRLLAKFIDAGNGQALDANCIDQIAAPPFIVSASSGAANAALSSGAGQ